MERTNNSLALSLVLLLVIAFLAGCQIEATPRTNLLITEALSTPTEAIRPSSTQLEQKASTPAPTLSQQVPATPTPQPDTTPEVWDYPASHYIYPVYGHEQTYELGCEASAAVDWANFFGLSIYEYSFQTALPLSDNPDFGFVGEVTTDAWGQIPPYAYGVHARPIADLLQAYGLPAKAVTGYSIDQVKQKLSEDKPIIVWVIGNMEYSNPVSYKDSQGRISIVAPYEHVVILTGYNETHLRYLNNGRFYEIPTEIFENSWSVLGNMAVIHE